ncbi:MAG: hypothetical protein ACYTDY_15090, partial [Planctomycetota bacterium]
REEEEAARLVPDALAAWRDVPPPEDGLHRLETRVAFAPPAPQAREPRGRMIRFALPYAAGFATAAVVMIVAMAVWYRPEPKPVTPAEPPSADTLFVGTDPALLPGEVPLHVVGPEGDLRRIPWDDPDVLRLLRRHLSEEELERIRPRTSAVPVDYWGD